MTDTVERSTANLDTELQDLHAKVDTLLDEAIEQRRRREAMEDLQADIAPIAAAAIEKGSAVLADTDIDVEATAALMVRLAEAAPRLEALLDSLEAVDDLVSELGPITPRLVQRTIDTATVMDERGYLEFATAAGGVVDRVVTSYSTEDVEALGENVVQILDIVKDLTQPEILAIARRLIDTVGRQAAADPDAVQKPPSLFALARRLREPNVRRGMARALDTVEAVSTPREPEPTNNTQEV